ncbi:MAG: PadR family transcriptional regulator [Cyanobacteria bacterium P01_F01_bin.42]
MLELAALGLLHKRPLHGYQLTKTLEISMGCCISINYGAIYPLLRRLESHGFIVPLSAAETAGSSSRIIYRITQAGRARWRSRMLETPNESWVNSRSRFMVKAFFFDHLEPGDRKALIQHRLAQCWEREKKLQSNGLLQDLSSYQAQTFEQGLKMLEVETQWLEQLLEQQKSLLSVSSP